MTFWVLSVLLAFAAGHITGKIVLFKRRKKVTKKQRKAEEISLRELSNFLNYDGSQQ